MGFLSDLFKPPGFDEAQKFNLQNHADYKQGWGSQVAPLFQQGVRPMMESVGAARAASADAQRMIGAQGAQAYRAILNTAKQGASGADQAGISSGLSGSSGAGQARAQALYQAGQTAAGLGANLAGQSANAALQGGAQVSGALRGLAGYYAQRAGARQQHLSGLMNFQAQAGGTSIGEGLLSLGGMALGGWLSKPSAAPVPQNPIP